MVIFFVTRICNVKNVQAKFGIRSNVPVGVIFFTIKINCNLLHLTIWKDKLLKSKVKRTNKKYNLKILVLQPKQHLGFLTVLIEHFTA